MILYENEKYSCVKCIRGHRSTSCKHINRALIKVHKRGRRNAENKGTNQSVSDKADTFNNGDDVIVVEDLDNVRIAKQEESVYISPGQDVYMKKEDDSFNVGGRNSCCTSETKFDPLNTGEEHCKSIKEPLLLLQPRTQHFNQQPTSSLESGIHCSKTSSSTSESGQSFLKDDFVVSKKHKPMTNIDIFKNNNIFLETKCSCSDDACSCENCIIHRLDEDLERYINSNLLTYPSQIVGKGLLHHQTNEYKEIADIGNEVADNELSKADTTANVITLKEIFQQGFQNLSHRIDSETRLKVNEKELVYIAWHPQVDLFNKDIITLAQLIKVLETL